MQYPSLGGASPSGFLQYRGRYTITGEDVTFEWEGWSTAGPWGATGTLKGSTLTVRYNTIMMLSDFEDAIYVLASSST